jgi:hypothetical protein
LLAYKEDDMDPRMKRLSALLLAVVLSPAISLGQTYPGRSDPDDFSEEEKIHAISESCRWLEHWFHQRSRKLEQRQVFAPHADYTHFNRVGKWSHQQIVKLKEREKKNIDFGGGFFDEQRKEAKAVFQPTDREVSIVERSLVTVVNMTGRSKDREKIHVAKHFPGGPPEIELTENRTFVDETPVEKFEGLIPFRYLNASGLLKAVMVGHAAYPRLEKAFAPKYFDRYERPIVEELSEYVSEAEYLELTRIRPASLSPILIRGILRNEVGFQGYVEPDVLSMGGVTQYIETFRRTARGAEVPAAAWTVILAIYAGINELLGLPQQGIEKTFDFIESYRKNHPHFDACYREAEERSAHASRELLQKDLALLFQTEPRNFDKLMLPALWVDGWDRSGKIHQVFRMVYFNTLYGTDRFLDEKNLKEFGALQEATDWKGMDPLFEKVLRERYGLPTFRF